MNEFLYLDAGICYSWWFLSLGITVGIAQALAPWVREKIVTGVQLSMDAVAYAGSDPRVCCLIETNK